MKPRTPLILIFLCLFAAPFARAERGLNETQKSQTISLINSQTSKNLSALEILDKRVAYLESQLAEFLNRDETPQLQESDSSDSEELSTVQQPEQVENSKGNIALWILLPIAAIVLSFVGFFFWLRNRGGEQPAPADPDARPKCPRCGWEHDPGDTICKNPACKTQF